MFKNFIKKILGGKFMNRVVKKETYTKLDNLNILEEKDSWNTLCNICSSLVEDANISKTDARKILKQVRNESHG